MADWQTLASSVSPNTEVIVIDPTLDGIAQVTKALDGLQNIQRVDFLTYGQAGQVELGANPITDATLQANASTIAGWRDHLADNAQIQFWGCDVGAGAAGVAFVNDLHALTGVGVAASSDATGLAALGGNWTLETTAGQVDYALPFSTAAAAHFMTVLDAPIPTVTLSGLPSQILLGDSFTATATFDNTATTGVGYGPYIDLFVPNNTLDMATLTSATLLGQNLSITSVTYSTSVPGHIGVLGALHPLLLDSSGQPEFVDAPPGAVEGGRMYVLLLPFGSFTPDQTVATVSLNFQLDKTSVVTDEHAGQQLIIGAIGGFAYGADALNNPSTDPGIRGTTGNPTETSAADGAVEESASVILVQATAQLVTTPGENETPTGPDFVAHYQITITPAPATNGDPITGSTATITLPDTVEYTGGPITITGASGGTATFVPGSAAEGGSVQVSLPSVAGPGQVVIDIPIFVPETAANGTPVLNPDTGAPTTITFGTASFNDGVWTPWAGSADAGQQFAVDGDLSGAASFTARSFAVQVDALDLNTNSTTDFRPGDTIEFTLKFEVSDYFNFNGLTMQALLDDAFTIDPSQAPVLTLTPAGGGTPTTIDLGTISGTTAVVNDQTVAVTGSNANWSFTRDNAGDGSTTIALTPSAAIATALGSSRLQGGVTGTLTLTAEVLDKYTNTHIDPVTGVGGSITERDVGDASVTGTATVVDDNGLPTTIPVSQVTDDSSVDMTIPQGTEEIVVVAVNGVATSDPNVNVQPGDVVTYAITYNLTTGDYESLIQSAFMPLPIVSTSDPLADGGSVTSFTEDTSATLGNPFPAAGKYFVSDSTGTMSVQSATVNAASNSIAFDFGHRDDTLNPVGRQATVLFSFVVTTAPFVDGLSLTAESASTLTNAAGVAATVNDLSGLTLSEPNLTQSAKTGIASLVDDSDAAKTGGFTVEGTGTSADPSTLYNPAGTPGSPFAGDGSGPETVGDLQNLNVTGADGSDTVRVIITIGNTGSSNGGSYDVTVSSALPTGYTIADVSNVTATRGGGLPVTLVANASYGTGTMAGLFTAGGVMLEDPGSSASTPLPTLYGVNDIAHRNVLTISYDLKLHPDQPAGTVLTEMGTIVNYTNVYNGVAEGNGFVVGGVPVGGNAADLVDNATVTTTSPQLAKSFGPSDVPQNDNVDPSFPNATVVVGETREITITVTLPEGTLVNGSNDVKVTELLPANETFRDLESITAGSGVTLTAGGASVSGNTVTFDLGPLVKNSNTDTPGTVTIKYLAYIADGSNVDGTTLPSTANLVYSGAGVPPVTITFVEHDPQVSATLTDDSGGIVFSDKTIDYTYTISNSGIVDAEATLSTLQLPTGLVYVPGSLHRTSATNSLDSATTVDDSNGAAGTLVVNPGIVDPGGRVTYTFQVTVAPDLASGTNLTTATTSPSIAKSIGAPQSPATARSYAIDANDPLFVRTLTTTLFISDEANGTTVVSAAAPVGSADVVIGDITRLHGQVLLPEGSDTNVVLDFTLPAGLSAFTTDGTITLALISDTGHILSSTIDPTGMAGVQVAEGTTAVDPTTFTPTFVVPASAIDTSVPGHLRISLGTVTDNSVSPLPNYAVVEFNAQVGNVVANQEGTSLQPTFLVSANGSSTPSSSVTETVREPDVALSKTATAINTAGNSVVYQVTLTNDGTATAYAVSLIDPLPANTTSITGFSAAGDATNLATTQGSGNIFTASMNLGVGKTETFTYTMTVANPLQPVPPTTTTETWQSLNPTITTAFGSTFGPVGSATGARDGSSLPTVGGLDDYWQQVVTSLGTASGQVWEALGTTPGTFDSAIDTPLAGVTVTHTSPGPDGLFGTADDLTQTAVTGIDGRYFFGLIPNGTFHITLPTSGSNGLPGSETLVYNTFGNLTANPAQATNTAIGTSIVGVNFASELPDTAPVIANWSDTVDPQIVLPGQTIYLTTTFATTASDLELDKLVAANEGYSYQGAVLTLQRYDGPTTSANAIPNAGDTFGGDSQLVFSGSNVVLNGVTIGTFVQSAGVLSLTFGAGTTSGNVAGVLNHLTYSNSSGTITPVAYIGAKLSDGNVNNVSLAGGATTGQQGTGGVQTSALVVSPVALGPTGTYTVTFVEPNDTPAVASAVPLVSSQLDLSGGQLTSIQIKLEGSGFTSAEDVLVFTNDGATMGDIQGSYNASTGTMTLTSATATAAEWSAAAGAVRYYNSSDTPHTVDRNVDYTFAVSSGVAPVGGILGHIHVVAANDSPVLDSSVTLTLADAVEDGSPPAGAVGTLVSALANTNITDPDGADAHDGSAPGPEGLAIVSADTTRGSWWYSTDNGATWTRFAGVGLTAISDTNALHLSADSSTRIFFQSTSPNFNGTSLTAALTVRAWDQADGVTNGTLSALPTDSPLGTGTNTAASAYSSATDVIPEIVDPVNDAPIASGTATLAATAEDTANPSGATVGTLFAADFSDTADDQTASGGSSANTLAGIAITGNTSDATQGVWRYSTDGGTTWTTISTSVSATGALVLSKDTLLDFLPVANFNGTPSGQLTARVIDNSTDVPVTGTTTGAALASGGAQAITNVDVTGSHSGGETAVSLADVPLTTTVSPVNDAPIASGTTTLAATAEDTANPTGSTVGTLFASNFSDTVDNQTASGGSSANTLAGIAITGNTSDTAQGVWRYSTDGGTTWTNIATSVSSSNALVLSKDTLLDFLPSANFNGTPTGQLTARVIDNSTDVPVTGTTTGLALQTGGAQAISGVDVSGSHSGGTTAVSLADVPLTTTVTPVNDAPIASGTMTLPSTAEDTANPSGATVGTLFAANFSDTADNQTASGGSSANTFAGIAITGNTSDPSQGVWRYSTDGGSTWTTISASVSASNALVLSQNALLDFQPVTNFNGTPSGQLSARIIDTSTDVPVTGTTTGAALAAATGSSQAIAGVDVSGSHSGGSTAVSLADVPLTTTVSPVNDAPIASGSAILVATPEDTANPAGSTVGTLFAADFSDTADNQTASGGSAANTLAGVAITGNTSDPTQGVWRYSTDGGTTWTNISASVSVSNALVLSKDTLLDFLPVTNFNGTPSGQLTARVIDNSTDVPVTGTTTGLALQTGGAQAISGVDVSGSHSGGTTAVSLADVPLTTTVSPVNDAPIASGTTTLAATAEDTANPSGSTVGTLFAADFSDTADNQTASGGSSANTLAGVAIAGNTSDPTQGTWRYSTDGGATWTNISTSVSASNALVLSKDTLLDFLPVTNFNGTPSGQLSARVIDNSTDVPVSGTTTGLVLQTGGAQAISGVDVSGSYSGGTTAVSLADVPLTTTVSPVNDAPIAAGSTTLAATPEDAANPSGATVGTLFAADFSDTADNQTASGGSSANTLAGVAITGNTSDPTQGTWRYSTDGGTTWTNISASVSASNALVLSKDTLIDFLPVTNFNGTPSGQLSARVIDNSTDVPVTGTTTGLALQTGGAQAIAGVDVSGSHSGGTTAVSLADVPLTTTVSPVNDAPIASGSTTLVATAEDTTNPPGSTVGTLFAADFSDTADNQTASGGSSANTLAGVAITGNTSDPAQGVWRYSTDGGSTWTNISASVSASNALVLSKDTLLDFLPVTNFNGTPSGQLSARVIDNSTDVPVSGTTTGLALQTGGAQAISGVDVSGSHSGGTTAVSLADVPLTTTVTPVNDAPIASGTTTLAATAEDTASPAGASVSTLFAANFSDTADNQTASGGSSANTLAGIAITGNTSDPAQGTWRYSTDGGATWTNISASVSASNALVLSKNALLDFLPVANFNGTPSGQLTARVIDNSTDVPVTGTTTGANLAAATGTAEAIAGVDVSGSHSAGTTAVSLADVPLTTTVSPVNDAPIASGTTSLPAAAEDTANPSGATVGTLFAANFSDTVDNQTASGGSAANTLAGIAITGNTSDPAQGTWRYSTDGGATWTNISASVSASNALVLSKDTLLDFLPVTNFNGTPSGQLTARVIDNSTDVPVTGSVTGLSLQIGGAQAIAGVDVSGSHSGATTAVSLADVPLTTAVTPVNDAPIASGSAALAPVDEDSAAVGQTVGTLFAANFSDTADNQTASGGGSSANTLAGIAITSVPVQLVGVWRYSTDNGATWTVILPGSVSTSNALVLSRNAMLDFLPAPNFNGSPFGLSARLIDTSTDVPLTGTTTGADLAAATGSAEAIAGVDVSGSHSGGSTAVSVAGVPLGGPILPVNDAPIASGSATLPNGVLGDPPPSDTVGDLFNPTFSDTADQQRTANNPTGSVANTLAGVVVVGNTTPASQGTWRYSTDDGVIWQAVPTTVSDSHGLVLGDNVRLAFFPASSFSGSPVPLMVRLIDSSSDVPVTGIITGAALALPIASHLAIADVDVSGAHNGGITAVSQDEVPLKTTVTLPPPPPTPTPNPPFFPPGPTAIESFFDGGLASDFLQGSSVYRTLLATQPGTINVSADVFTGSGDTSNLQFEATTVSGAPLPPWLYFDPTLLQFRGTPPESAVGSLDLRIIATDRQGRQAEAEVHIVIMRPFRDLFPLLVQQQHHLPVPPLPPSPPSAPPAPAPSPDAAPPVNKAPAGPDGPPPAPPPSTPAPAPAIQGSLGGFGFSAQLREQSLAGRLTRSRALLNALAQGGAD